MARTIATVMVDVKANTAAFRSGIAGMGSDLNSAFRKISGAVSALGLDRLAREAISMGTEYRIQLDNARAALAGLIPNEQQAGDLMERMTQMAIQTPFDLPGIQNATTRLLAYGEGFGVTGDAIAGSRGDVLGWIEDIGNAAAISGKGSDAMLNIITTMGKISGQGRVMTRDMNQLTANLPALHPWEVLSEMTGKTQQELRKLAAQPGGLSGIVDTTEFINQLRTEMQEIPGAADAMKRKMATLGGTMEMFKDLMGVALADGLQPFFTTLQGIMNDPSIQNALKTIIQTFGDLVSMIMQELAPVLPNLINAFQNILVALMPLAPAIADLVMMFAMGLVTLAPFITVLSEVVAWIMNLLMQLDPGLLGVIAAALIVLWLSMAGPVVGVIAGITALMVAIKMAWPYIVEATRAMAEAFVAAWDWLFQHVIEPVKNFIQDIIDFFQKLYDFLVGNSIIPDLVNAIVDWFNKLWNFIKSIFTGIWNFLVTIWNTIYNTIKAVVSAVVNFVRDHWQLLIAIIAGPLGIIVALVISNWNSIKTFLSNVWNGIKSTATAIWNGIKSAIIDPITTAVTKAKELVQSILDKVRSAWSGIVSFVSGVWNGIKDAIVGPITSAWHTVQDIVGKITNAVQNAIDTVGNIAHAGGNWNPVNWFAEGGIIQGPRVVGVGEHGPEAIVPMTNPGRAMQVMHEAGLDRMFARMGNGQNFNGPLVSMPGAVIQDATDADLVAQRTLVAMQGAMVA